MEIARLRQDISTSQRGFLPGIFWDVPQPALALAVTRTHLEVRNNGLDDATPRGLHKGGAQGHTTGRYFSPAERPSAGDPAENHPMSE